MTYLSRAAGEAEEGGGAAAARGGRGQGRAGSGNGGRQGGPGPERGGARGGRAADPFPRGGRRGTGRQARCRGAGDLAFSFFCFVLCVEGSSKGQSVRCQDPGTVALSYVKALESPVQSPALLVMAFERPCFLVNRYELCNILIWCRICITMFQKRKQDIGSGLLCACFLGTRPL